MRLKLSDIAALSRSAIIPLRFAPVVAIMFAPLFAPVLASDGAASRILNPAQIDQAVTAFTGARIGEAGGARAPADRRLRLAACTQPLITSWHGTAQTAVRVECPTPVGGSRPWKIFVATRPVPGQATASAYTRAASVAPVVKRGDPITVVVRGRGFSVQQSGEALENGAIGDWIGIRTARRTDPVSARIERPGLAVIPSN
jgi:flagella basal body P-ring formation protein FlgA